MLGSATETKGIVGAAERLMISSHNATSKAPVADEEL